jgi:transcriptional regulator with XRE-family HTH domain
MKRPPVLGAEEVRRVRRALDETQAEFAKRLGVDPVTVARWETGQRTCAGLYAVHVARLDPEGRLPVSAAFLGPSSAGEEARLDALTQLVRAFFQGSTAKAVSALVEREKLSAQDLDDLAALIRRKRRGKGGAR